MSFRQHPHAGSCERLGGNETAQRRAGGREEPLAGNTTAGASRLRVRKREEQVKEGWGQDQHAVWSHISRGDGARGRVRESGRATCGVGIGVKHLTWGQADS